MLRPMVGDLHRLHGLTVRAPLALGARAAHHRDVVDVALVRSEPAAVPARAPEGAVEARLGLVDGYTVARDRDGTVRARFPGTCELRFAGGSSAIALTVDPEADEEIVGLIVAGAGLAAWCGTQGSPLLHASAVEHEGRALAVIGPSGTGKSTVAMLLCGAGARLVTDDTLRVSPEGEGFVAHAGGTQIRLRPGVARLTEIVPGAVIGPTADHRVGVTPEQMQDDRAPLVALVAPEAVRGLLVPVIERLGGAEAIKVLAGASRLRWTGHDAQRALFDQLTRLAARVPVLRARYPWGPPVGGSLGADLLVQLARLEAER